MGCYHAKTQFDNLEIRYSVDEGITPKNAKNNYSYDINKSKTCTSTHPDEEISNQNIQYLSRNNSDEEFDYFDHANKIFQIINDLRNNPSSYVKIIGDLIKKIDRKKNIIDLSEDYHIQIKIPPNLIPEDALAFLETARAQSSILWSDKVYNLANEELDDLINTSNNELVIKKSFNELITLSDIFKGNFIPSKILTNFILAPDITVSIIFLLSQENRTIIFSEKVFVGSVACIVKENFVENGMFPLSTVNVNVKNVKNGKTLIYFVNSTDN